MHIHTYIHTYIHTRREELETYGELSELEYRCIRVCCRGLQTPLSVTLVTQVCMCMCMCVRARARFISAFACAAKDCRHICLSRLSLRYVCVYVYVCVSVHSCVLQGTADTFVCHACHSCTYVHVCVCVCALCISAFMYVHVCACVCMCMCVCVCALCISAFMYAVLNYNHPFLSCLSLRHVCVYGCVCVCVCVSCASCIHVCCRELYILVHIHA